MTEIELYIKKLVPRFGEDLISFPLWEEGDYRPVVTTDLFVPTEGEYAGCDEEFMGLITKKYAEGWVAVEFELENIRQASEKKHYRVRTYQRGYILDKGLVPSYDPTPLLKVQVDIYDEWDTFISSKKQ